MFNSLIVFINYLFCIRKWSNNFCIYSRCCSTKPRFYCVLFEYRTIICYTCLKSICFIFNGLENGL
nr:MAG TPA: hypothetical protein [Caudoviricetes sp.]